MHISEQVRAALVNDGWTERNQTFTRTIATGGAFGSATQTLRIDPTGRWLERFDGWGTVERDTDLRDWPDNPAGAVNHVLE